MTLSVMTLNLRHGWAEDGRHDWEHRRKAVLDLFALYQPDFIGTQEGTESQLFDLIQGLRDYNCLGPCRGGGERWEYNNLFYKSHFRPVAHELFYLSETPDRPSRSWGSRWPRSCIRGAFDLDGALLNLFNTHFDFEEPAQMGGALLIWEKTLPYLTAGPAILMGDFNATPEARCYRFLTGKISWKGRTPDWRDSFAEPQPFTYHAFTGTPQIGYIDWILYRGGLSVTRRQVLDPACQGTYYSDHYPVWAAFSIG